MSLISSPEPVTQLLEQVTRIACKYLHDIDHRPTSSKAEIPKPVSLPMNGLGGEIALQQFMSAYEPLMVSSSGPRYWGFVTGGSTPAAIAGDWLAAVYDQNPQSVNGAGDRSAIIEQHTIDLLLELFSLPKEFLGGFVTGATMSNFTCLGVARQWLGKQLGLDIAREGVSRQLHVLTTTPHSSAIKSLSMLGIGSSNFIRIRQLEGNREAMDMKALEEAILTMNGEPFILISSGGTVNTVDFDDMLAIAALKKRYSFWWHIDAAFGGFASLSATHKYLLDGWEQADSITVDCHKWLNVPYDSAIFLVRNEHRSLQVQTFQNSNAPYLGDPLQDFNYLNFLPDNSRRLKALPAWFSLMAYGRSGYISIVENCIQLALRFGQLIEADTAFELLAPVRLNTVCFSLAGEEGQKRVIRFLDELNETGLVFMTPTVYNGKKGIRAAFVNWQTTSDDVDRVMERMKQLAT